MGSVIVVTSGKGGTGKTSITGGVGSCLARLGKSVLCIDMDIGLRNLDISLGLSDRALMDFSDVVFGRCSLEKAAVSHPDLPGLSLLTAPMSFTPQLTQWQVQELLDAAFAAMQHAYAPYSRYHVGACVKTKDGKLIPGVNIENASFGLTNCAERSAIFAAYSMGYRREDIVAIAIVSDGTKLAAPCGACRQVLVELLQQDTPIVLSNKQEQKITSIAELLPMSFTSEDVL